jgi:hypothetical protein
VSARRCAADRSGAALTRGGVSRRDGISKRARKDAHIRIDPPIELSVIDERSNSLDAILNAPHAASKGRKEKIILFHADLRDLDCAICVRGLLQRSGKSARQRKKALLPPLQPGKREKSRRLWVKVPFQSFKQLLPQSRTVQKDRKRSSMPRGLKWAPSNVSIITCRLWRPSTERALQRRGTLAETWREFFFRSQQNDQERRAKVGPAQLARA